MENDNYDVTENLTGMVKEFCKKRKHNEEEVFQYISKNFIVSNRDSFIVFEYANGEIMITYTFSRKRSAILQLLEKLEGDMKELNITRIRANVDMDVANAIARLFPDYRQVSVVLEKELMDDGQSIQQ